MTSFRNKYHDFGLTLVFMFFLIFVIAFSSVNILKFRSFSATSFGWQFTYVYPKLAKFQNPFSFVPLPEFNIVFFLSPINYLLAFIYNILPKPETLFILQGIIMGSGAFPVYLLVKKRLCNTYLAVSFSVLFLFHPIVTTGALLGYIPLSLGLPFLLCSFYYLERMDFGKFSFYVIAAMMSKIDVVVMVLILGIILLFSKQKNKYGIIILKISLIWSIVVLTICGIYLKTVNRAFPVGLLHFDKYGDTVICAFRYFLNNPQVLFTNFFNKNNMLGYVFSFPLNIICLFCPIFLTPAIPELGYVIMRNQHSSGHFLILACVFVSAIYGSEKIINFISKLTLRQKPVNLTRIFTTLFATFLLVFSIIRHYNFEPKSGFSEALGPLPLTKYFRFSSYAATKHIITGDKFLKKIPDAAACLTSQSLAVHLGKCRLLWLLNREIFKYSGSWDYIFLDLTRNDFYQISREQFLEEFKRCLIERNYGVVDFDDGWVLLKKWHKQNRNPEVLAFVKKKLPI